MTVSYQSLRDFDQNAFVAAMSGWSNITGDFEEQFADYQKSVLAPVTDGSWTGTAAAKAQQAVQRSNDRLAATDRYLDTVTQAIGQAVNGMAMARNHLDSAFDLVRSNGLEIDDAGHVRLAGEAVPVDWDAPPILGGMFAQRIIYEARYMAEMVNRTVSPILGNATKFGQQDDGPWLADSIDDQRTALAQLSDLPDRLTAVMTTAEPADPDTLAQPYDVDPPGLGDWELATEMATGGEGYFALHGWFNARRLLDNWLRNTGAWALVDPARMMADIPSFTTAVNRFILDDLRTGVQDTSWQRFGGGDDTQSLDWYYALNDFRYRVVCLVTTDSDGTQNVDYTVGVKKPYVFGPPRQPIKVGDQVFVTQEELQHLHTTGLAQNFIAQGISSLVL